MARDAGALIAIVLLSAGCGGKAITAADIEKPNTSLVYGYLDMSDAPTRLQSFSVKQVLPETKSPYWGFAVDKGVFSHSALPPGSYQLSSFSGQSGLHLGVVVLGGQSYTYNFPAQGNGFRVAKPGLHYVGSYKYKRAGTFWNAKFDIEAAKTPTERQLLEKLLVKVTHPKWQEQIKRRLAELKR